MQTKFGFTKMSFNEFSDWMTSVKIARTIIKIQQHHTYIPQYADFTGSNHFDLQKGMQNTHKYTNGWMDIGQHFSIFPDGSILTGRSLEYSPACIYNQNANSICIENVGNFDEGGDDMTTEQMNAIIDVTALLCHKFNLFVDTNFIVYHHWFRLDNGFRNNGAGGNKSCPGSAFFGGNKVDDCKTHFLPKVSAKLQDIIQINDDSDILKYAIVTTGSLNVRESHSASSGKVSDRNPVQYGAILRVYEINDGWYKISKSASHWVSGRYTNEVERYIVKATTLNIRSGPASTFSKVGQIYEKDQVFIEEKSNNWARIAATNNWVSMTYLTNF
jgi:hypothetical protein